MTRPHAALAVFETQAQVSQNLRTMQAKIAEAAGKAQLVVFSEMALSGFVLSGRDAQTDLSFAVAADGAEIGLLRESARSHGVWVAFGFLERAHGQLFDSALLLDDAGRTRLHYRRISPTWHWPDAPATFEEGHTVPVAVTPFGRVAFLICGDAFCSEALARLRDGRPTLLLLPLARGFDEDAPNIDSWRAEHQLYADALRDLVPTTLAINSLGAGMVGGAFRAEAGSVRETLPLNVNDLMIVDLPTPHARKEFA